MSSLHNDLVLPYGLLPIECARNTPKGTDAVSILNEWLNHLNRGLSMQRSSELAYLGEGEPYSGRDWPPSGVGSFQALVARISIFWS